MTATKAEKNSYKNARPFIEYLEHKAGFRGKKDEDDGFEKLVFDEKKIDRAALSDLRKDLGKPPNKAIFAMKYLAQWTRDFNDPWDTECYYCVGTLFALYQQKIGKKENLRKSWHHDENLKFYQRNFGASFHKLEEKIREERANADNKEKLKTLEQRFTTVIRSKRAELPVRLRHAVLFLASHEIQINWLELLLDLMRWKRFESPFAKKGISPQRSWSQSFWKVSEGNLEENTEEKK